MSKDFYLIYVDEFGNTGDKLDTPDQPYYMLQAALVEPGEKWLNLESGLLDIAFDLRDRMGLKHLPHLHMVEIYQRSGFYKEPNTGAEPLSVDEAFDYLDRVFSLIGDYNVQFMTYGVDKLKLIEAARAVNPKPRPQKKVRDFRQMAFLMMLNAVDNVLREMDAYGAIYYEQERGDVDNQISSSTAYAAMRKKGLLTRLLGSPLHRSKRACPLLAVADFSGYVMGSAILVGRFGRKERPRLREWLERYILPASIRHFEGGRGTSFNTHEELVGLYNFMAAFHTLTHDPEADIGSALQKFHDAEELAAQLVAAQKEQGGEDAP